MTDRRADVYVRGQAPAAGGRRAKRSSLQILHNAGDRNAETKMFNRRDKHRSTAVRLEDIRLARHAADLCPFAK